MRTRLLALLLGAASVGGYIGVAQADPGPNLNNDYGLCTAYSNGQKNGHGTGEDQPGPFANLETHAEENAPRNNDADDGNDVTGTEAIFDYCNGVAGGIGGNPDHGRFLCTVDNPETQEDEFGCEPNEAPGNSGESNARGHR